MNICVLTPFFLPQIGGVQIYTQKLLSSFLKLYPHTSIDIITYHDKKSISIEKQSQLTIYRIPSRTILPEQFVIVRYAQLKKLLGELKAAEKKYDVLISNTRFFDNTLWGLWFAKQFNAKTILIDHASTAPNLNNPILNFLVNLLDKYFISRMIKKYDAILPVSQKAQRYLSSIGIENSEVLYAGVDTPDKKRLYLPNGQIRFAFVGRLIEEKGVMIFLASAEKLLKKYKNVQFSVTGEGPLRQKIKHQYGNMITLQSLPPDEVVTVYRDSDVLVQPSIREHEGLPLVLLEAAAQGCAVISTDVGGASEIISNKENGLLISGSEKELFQAMRLLIEHPNQIPTWGQRLQKTVLDHFSWEKTAKQLKVTIERLY
jgi:glycosyltransferase involved in cell wall biosynthesis